MQAVLEKKSNLLFGKFASFFKSFSSKFPLVITSRKKLEESGEELGDAHSEVACLHKAMLEHQEHFNELLGVERDLFEEQLLDSEQCFLRKHTLKSLKEAWLRRRCYDINLDARWDACAPSWVPEAVERLVQKNADLLNQEDMAQIEELLDDRLPRYLFEVFKNKPTSMSKHSH